MAACLATAAETDVASDLSNIPEEQHDEVLALQSIFEDTDNFIILSRPEDEKYYMLQIEVEMQLAEEGITVDAYLPYEGDDFCPDQAAASLPTSKRPEYQRSVSGRRWTATFQLSHLLPLNLQVTFPPSYPASEAPLFTISCLWLNSAQLTAICHQLDQLWGEQKGMPILYTWVDWLQSKLLCTLGLDNRITIVEHFVEDLVMRDESRDPRALPLGSHVSLDLIQLLRYNLHKEWAVFQHEHQECGICFDTRHGSEFFKMPECAHVCCQDCMMAYVEMHVTDGTVQQLSCPHHDCKAGLPHEVIRAILGEDAYIRWERLVLERALDTLGDVVWCPRCQMAGARDDNLGKCSACNFTFCTQCEETWHGGTQCKTIEEQMEELGRQASSIVKSMTRGRKRRQSKKQGATVEEQDFTELTANSELTQKELRKKMAELRTEYLTKSVIRSTCKPCPNCKVNIHKFGGCNKVTCSLCKTIMCWVCGKRIHGYEHFHSGACILFPGQEILHPAHLQNRAVNVEGRMVGEAIRGGNPDILRRVIGCPTCRQRCLKEGRNNHLRCWQCKTAFCFMCKNKIEGKSLSSHYMAASACVQHSD